MSKINRIESGSTLSQMLNGFEGIPKDKIVKIINLVNETHGLSPMLYNKIMAALEIVGIDNTPLKSGDLNNPKLTQGRRRTLALLVGSPDRRPIDTEETAREIREFMLSDENMNKNIWDALQSPDYIKKFPYDPKRAFVTSVMLIMHRLALDSDFEVTNLKDLYSYIRSIDVNVPKDKNVRSFGRKKRNILKNLG